MKMKNGRKADFVLVNGSHIFTDVDLLVRQKCIVEGLPYVLAIILIDRKIFLVFPIFLAANTPILRNIWKPSVPDVGKTPINSLKETKTNGCPGQFVMHFIPNVRLSNAAE
jgi:hypothetical protein